MLFSWPEPIPNAGRLPIRSKPVGDTTKARLESGGDIPRSSATPLSRKLGCRFRSCESCLSSANFLSLHTTLFRTLGLVAAHVTQGAGPSVSFDDSVPFRAQHSLVSAHAPFTSKGAHTGESRTHGVLKAAPPAPQICRFR
jgi:hypothetical protein